MAIQYFEKKLVSQSNMFLPSPYSSLFYRNSLFGNFQMVFQGLRQELSDSQQLRAGAADSTEHLQ